MRSTVKTVGVILSGILLALGSGRAAQAAGCGEASCNSAQGTYISHFTNADCTGTESYYLPYDSFGYQCRSYDGGGECGTIQRTVTNRSWRDSSGCHSNAWPSGNTLSQFVTVYRPKVCGEAGCNSVQGTYISHFTNGDCTGTESYYLPYDSFGYQCRTYNGSGECGTIQRTVTNRSWRDSSGCHSNAWPSGNTLSQFVTVYRSAPPPPTYYPPVACGYPTSSTYGPAPLSVSFSGICSYDPDGGAITGYYWSFGDGQVGSFSFEYHTYLWPGNYSVWLTVVDDEGQSSTAYVGSITAH